jgi:hypothetical protein
MKRDQKKKILIVWSLFHKRVFWVEKDNLNRRKFQIRWFSNHLKSLKLKRDLKDDWIPILILIEFFFKLNLFEFEAFNSKKCWRNLFLFSNFFSILDSFLSKNKEEKAERSRISHKSYPHHCWLNENDEKKWSK